MICCRARTYVIVKESRRKRREKDRVRGKTIEGEEEMCVLLCERLCLKRARLGQADKDNPLPQKMSPENAYLQARICRVLIQRKSSGQKLVSNGLKLKRICG